MKSIAISDHSYQMTRLGLFNCFAVCESDGYTLIDAGLPNSEKGIMEAVQSFSVGQICRILLTHAHGDHIGSLDALAHLLGNVKIAISQRDARLLPKPPAQDRSLDPGEPQTKVRGSLPGAKSVPTHFVADGELYGSLRCFATPGHTPGHFSFLDERDGTLFAGDAVVNVGGSAHVSGYGPWYFPLPQLATWHRPTALVSMQRLLALTRETIPVRQIAAGHGRVVSNGDAALEKAIAVATTY